MSLPTKKISTITNDDDHKIDDNIDQQQQLIEIVNKNENEKESVIETVNTSIDKTLLPDNDESLCTDTVASNNPTTAFNIIDDLETSLVNNFTVAKTASTSEISSTNNNNNNNNNNLVDSNDSNSISTQESNIESSDPNEDHLKPELSTSTTGLDPIATESTISTTQTNSVSNLSSQEYHLKWIKWKVGNSGSNGSNNNNNNNNGNGNGNGNNSQPQQQPQKVPIVTQNSNGSCPLLAIINVLLLRKNITFPPIIEIVTASQLMDYLCDCILTYVPKNLPEQDKLNYEQNLQDAMSIMPRLQTGLDVNVKFTGIMDFEYTPECIIFDLLRIPLYHGWLVDPQQREISRVINNQSYNQLVDRIIGSKTTNSNDNEMFLAEEFLNQTASQLTNYGLSQLIRHIKDDEISILFRNNHFITMYRHKGKLYQLVTDQGFLTEPNVVWESLNNIEGDDYFVDADFQLVPPKPLTIPMPLSSSSTMTTQLPNLNIQQQIDQDYLIALSLEQEQNFEDQQQQQRNVKSRNFADNNNLNKTPIIDDNQKTLLSDEELARKLQAEEDQYYEQQQLRQQPKKLPTTHENKTYASVVSSSQQQQQQHTMKTTKDSKSGNCLPNHYQISSSSDIATCNTNAITTSSCHHPQSSTTKSSSTIPLSGHYQQQHPRTSTSSSSTSSHHHQHKQQQQQHTNPSHHQRSTSTEQSASTPVTPTTTTSRTIPDDRHSVSSRRSQNKNCTIS
nr:ubiquitin carboxyl-terminal hydrolase MINDY-1-like [Dermatophagoides farinae]